MGASATFTVTTNTGYTASVSEGTLVGTTWTIPNVTSTHTATVTFTINSYIISGFARTSGGTGISDVVMDGLPGNPVTRGDGFYSATIPYNWSGTVFPTRSGYKFNPHSMHYANVIEDRITEDCIGQPIQSFLFFDDFSTDKGWFGYEAGDGSVVLLWSVGVRTEILIQKWIIHLLMIIISLDLPLERIIPMILWKKKLSFLLH